MPEMKFTRKLNDEKYSPSVKSYQNLMKQMIDDLVPYDKYIKMEHIQEIIENNRKRELRRIEEMRKLPIDIDGNEYKIVRIGDQIWMAENLKVTRYRNGDKIPTGHSNSSWSSLSTGAYAVYNGDENNANTYGYLYNWYTVNDSRNIAPEGWHVPSDDEWITLTDYLDNHRGRFYIEGDAGSQLAGNTDLWNNGNLEYNLEFGTSGFTALPGGLRKNTNRHYNWKGERAFFWSSSQSNNDRGWIRWLSSSDSGVNLFKNGKNMLQNGYSVRCLRD